MNSSEQIIEKIVPQHVAIIMDGNGRWAKKKGKIRTFGHRAGVKAVRASVSYALKNGVQVLTLFAFSSENWNRPTEEVGVLMELFKMVLGSEVKKLHKNNVRLKIIGDTSRFDSKLVNQIRDAETLTEKNNSLVLNIAANYGGRWDIVNATKELITQVQAGQIDVADIDEETFTRHTCAADLPAVDLLIRTGGEQRISNFLLWQIAYAELYFSEDFWPDFNEAVFQAAVDAFTDRQRRFGKTSEQVS
ncbi:polyprenyl diphosphate synthase [Paraglaciecola psychrophila]|uniref:Ditrans,polycis-undecaprenyl-diphosphate synthase ((2E,6E)-farnesyl-diphosphate specific) n=1 Tax=Paraglaciecola psychrophila 170 TaxID=1129794 RepID=K6Z2J8_9ALTE|nr:polyprenyl diphosphate synthase [Paraglaciecola psychrophila]AGH46206.1 UDP diphosphate synthase [Paraglaciecola psychrophila 170]GAC39269.1 undecaprenyl diphosphate synthase [Paraglaciecola psychrophila 170]